MLDATKLAHVESGRKLREDVKLALADAFNIPVKKVTYKPHYVIRSSPGVGKTFTVNQFILENNL